MLGAEQNPERPIAAQSDDTLERSSFVKRLSAAVVSRTTGTSTGIVLGITGPWGSGKSSVLNLLQEEIRSAYPEALSVRFDPWLVSGHSDLIADFLGEMIGTINANHKNKERLKTLGSTLAHYGAQLAPTGNLFLPGIGAVIAGGLGAIQKALSEKKSLIDIRLQLVQQLDQIDVPIVVLVDEIDRVDDAEIRTVAQLVRAVADFPKVSYVLAYDADRVIQALGSGPQHSHAIERGRSYLEKIVQFQIPLPAIFEDDLKRILAGQLSRLSEELKLPENFSSIDRYVALVEILVASSLIYTLRDTQRLIGTYQALRGMLIGEVDWIDLLAFSALLVKAPSTVERIRRYPFKFLGAASQYETMEQFVHRERYSKDEMLHELLPDDEESAPIKELVRYLFPWLSEYGDHESGYSDALSQRRPLLTTLRLGLLSGSYSRDQIQEIVALPRDEVVRKFEHVHKAGQISQLVDRLDELYEELKSIDHCSFWQGVNQFVKKPDCEWQASYSSMGGAVRELASVLPNSVRRNEEFRDSARTVFDHLRNEDGDELITHWLRHHIFAHGLFGKERRSDRSWFIDAKQTEIIAQELAATWREEHIASQLLPCRWTLQPVFTMLDVGVWDDACRETLDYVIADDAALGGFTLLLFGGAYSTDFESASRICDYQSYLQKVHMRLAKNEGLHESVRIAMERAKAGA